MNLLTSRGVRRELLYLTTEMSTHSYHTEAVTVRRPTGSVQNAALVSSVLVDHDETPTGHHTPTLDVDFDVDVLCDQNDNTWLWLDRNLLGLRDWWLRRRLWSAGLLRSRQVPDRTTLRLHHDLQAWRATQMVGTIADGFNGTFEQLWTTAYSTADSPGDNRQDAEVPEGGILLPVVGTMIVLNSSTPGHHHVLSDQMLPKRDWKKMMRAFKRAGILERGYYKASVRRGAAHLRRPGVTKHNEPRNTARLTSTY